MTTITYTEDEFKIEMAGHAGAGPAGCDLVCAALSMLKGTLEAAAEDYEETMTPDYYMADGFFCVRFHPEFEDEEKCRTILQTIYRGCEVLSDQYPQHVQTIKQEG